MSVLALFGGEPVRREPWPQWPVFDERDVQAVSDVVRSGQWGGFPYPGPQTQTFLRRFLEMQGGAYAVAAANGTLTLEIALRAAGIGWGDEVIIPAYTFQATAAGPMAAGAVPVIVDVDPNTYCISPAAVEAAITQRTRAIIPVHVAQQMADMDAIMAIAERHNLIVLEDAAHAHGSALAQPRRRNYRPLRFLQPAIHQDLDGGRGRHPDLPYAGIGRPRREHH